MNYYLGVDIGTTATKAVAFSVTGEAIISESIDYGMKHPQHGWSEQDPYEILQAVIDTINRVVETLAPQVPSFVAFSAAMHSLLAVDEKGNPITNCIIWADNRAYEIADNLRNTALGHRLYETTGVPVHSMSPLCKLLWLKENEASIFNTAFKFIGIKEYVFFKLFGIYVVDSSVASTTGMLNLKSLQWEEEILQFVGINAERLPQVVSTRHILYYNHPGALSIPLHTPFIVGGSDGALSNLGSGATGGKSLAITIGTSGAARMMVTEAQTDRYMRTFCYHAKDHEYIVGGATNNGAVVLQWLKEKLLQTNESYEALFEQAKGVAPGSDGLLLLPYVLGERAPIWNSNAKGVFFGLSVQHQKAHLIRAAMEGVIFCLYSISKVIFETREVTELYASGGFARSAHWLQMLADIFNKKVLVSAAVESAALGAVMIGAEALGIEYSFSKPVSSEYQPIPLHHQMYSKCFEKFERIYEILKEEMN